MKQNTLMQREFDRICEHIADLENENDRLKLLIAKIGIVDDVGVRAKQFAAKIRIEDKDNDSLKSILAEIYKKQEVISTKWVLADGASGVYSLMADCETDGIEVVPINVELTKWVKK